jgi:hypothetical protein
MQSHPIVPNYREEYTTENAYADTAHSILMASGNLDLLSVPGKLAISSTKLNLPTWVPDWSAPPCAFSFLLKTSFFAATGSSTRNLIFRDERRVLGLIGYVFDEVERIGHDSADRPAPLLNKEDTNMFRYLASSNIQFWRLEIQNLRAWKNWLHLTSAWTRETYVTGEPMLDAYWKTFLGGCEGDKLAEYHKECEDLVGRSAGPSGILDNEIVWAAYCIASNGVKKLRDSVLRVTRPIGEEPFLCMYGRRMFISKNMYIGLGPKDMKTGDCLALLEGGQVPYVLRRKGQMYELVGDCYINGVMQGELYEKSICERIWLA